MPFFLLWIVSDFWDDLPWVWDLVGFVSKIDKTWFYDMLFC
jgi:hypothetical protein